MSDRGAKKRLAHDLKPEEPQHAHKRRRRMPGLVLVAVELVHNPQIHQRLHPAALACQQKAQHLKRLQQPALRVDGVHRLFAQALHDLARAEHGHTARPAGCAHKRQMQLVQQQRRFLLAPPAVRLQHSEHARQ